MFPSDVGACVYEYAHQLNAVDDLFVIDRTLLARQRSLSRDSPQRLEGWLGLARLLIDSSFEIRVRGRRNPDRSRVRSGRRRVPVVVRIFLLSRIISLGWLEDTDAPARVYGDYRWTGLVGGQRKGEEGERQGG